MPDYPVAVTLTPCMKAVGRDAASLSQCAVCEPVPPPISPFIEKISAGVSSRYTGVISPNEIIKFSDGASEAAYGHRRSVIASRANMSRRLFQ